MGVQNLFKFLTLIITTLIEGKVAFNYASKDFQVIGVQLASFDF